MKIGEIVETSTTEFTTECYELNQVPAFGSLVKTSSDKDIIYGIVFDVSTGSIDPSRKPTVLGSPETSSDELLSKQPQLKKLLRTSFKAIVVGYNNKRFLPPFPPRLHETVTMLSEKEIDGFEMNFEYLKALLEISDDLVAAHIRYMCQGDKEKALKAAKVVTEYLKNDHQRLTDILKRLE